MKYPAKDSTHEVRLSNGLPVCVVNVVGSHTVTVMLLVKAGSLYDLPEKSGTAHFLEHMFFKGTKLYPSSNDLAMEIEMMGGFTNAFTSYEYTGYYIKVPRKNVLKAVQLLAQVITEPIFDEKEIQKEKGVIREEIRMYNDLPSEIVKDEFNKTLFQDDPLGKSITGSSESIATIDRNVIKRYEEEYYHSNNMMLVVSGDVDMRRILGEIETSFSKVREKKSISRRILFKPSLLRDTRIKHIAKDSEQAHIVIGGYAFPRNSEFEYPFKLGMNILTDGFGSKLFQSLRENLGIAYYVGGGVATFSNVGKYIISAGLASEKVEEGINAILMGMRELLDGNIEQKEFIRAKNYYIASLMEEFETAEDQAGWYGLSFLFKKKYRKPEELTEKIENIQLEDVIASWQKLLSQNKPIITVLSKVLNKGMIENVIN